MALWSHVTKAKAQLVNYGLPDTNQATLDIGSNLLGRRPAGPPFFLHKGPLFAQPPRIFALILGDFHILPIFLYVCTTKNRASLHSLHKGSHPNGICLIFGRFLYFAKFFVRIYHKK